MTLKRRKMDERGALEGLPLYLIILVVIAGIGIAILAGWMMSSRTADLDYIEVDVGGSSPIPINTPGRNITVTAYDQNGKTIRGAIVTMEGHGVNEIGETNSRGQIVFNNVKPTLPANEHTGTILVTVSYTGNMPREQTRQIPVRR